LDAKRAGLRAQGQQQVVSAALQPLDHQNASHTMRHVVEQLLDKWLKLFAFIDDGEANAWISTIVHAMATGVADDVTDMLPVKACGQKEEALTMRRRSRPTRIGLDVVVDSHRRGAERRNCSSRTERRAMVVPSR